MLILLFWSADGGPPPVETSIDHADFTFRPISAEFTFRPNSATVTFSRS